MRTESAKLQRQKEREEKGEEEEERKRDAAFSIPSSASASTPWRIELPLEPSEAILIRAAINGFITAEPDIDAKALLSLSCPLSPLRLSVCLYLQYTLTHTTHTHIAQ